MVQRFVGYEPSAISFLVEYHRDTDICSIGNVYGNIIARAKQSLPFYVAFFVNQSKPEGYFNS